MANTNPIPSTVGFRTETGYVQVEGADKLQDLNGDPLDLLSSSDMQSELSGYVSVGGALGTPLSGNLVNCTFPTLNQSTTGSAATLTTPRTIYGNSFNGSANLTQPITITSTSFAFTQQDSSNNVLLQMRGGPLDSNNIVLGRASGANISIVLYAPGGYNTGVGNTLLGSLAGNALNYGSYNTLVGANAGAALSSTSGVDPNIVSALNTLIGADAGSVLTTGYANVMIGQKAGLKCVTSQLCVMIGKSVGAGTGAAPGDGNTWISGGRVSASGANTVLIGNTAGDTQTGSNNVLIGTGAGYAVTASFITAIGSAAGNLHTSGTECTYVGSNAGRVNTTGYQVTYVGSRAGELSTASEQVAIGSFAGYQSSGSGCVFIGNSAGYSNTSGNSNVFIGDYAGYNNTTRSNQFICGDGIFGRIDNVYFGKGYSHATPTAYTINGTAGSGTNIAGADINIASGIGTGTGASGTVTFKTAPIGSSGSTLNSLVNAGQFDASTTAGDTRFLLWDVTGASLKRVSIGAADSGGTGYKLLRITN